MKCRRAVSWLCVVVVVVDVVVLHLSRRTCFRWEAEEFIKGRPEVQSHAILVEGGATSESMIFPMLYRRHSHIGLLGS